MNDLSSVTAETLEQMQPAMRESLARATTTGFTTALGAQGFELEAPAKFLVPVLSPFRNRIARRMAQIGSLNANWKAITGINVGNANPFVAFGVAGTVVQTTLSVYQAAYVPLALGDTVQMDAQVLAKGFDDLRARSGTNLLFALMIAEDRMLLGGESFALQTPGTPTVATATTGGTIALSTAVNFVVAARNIEGYYLNLSLANGTGAGAVAGGGTVTSANGTVTTGGGTSTNTATASVASVAGAVAYDWYAGATNAAYYFIGTTTTNVSPILTALPGADATNPSVAAPQVSPARSGGGLNVRTAFVDTSADANAFNGLLASMAGDVNAAGAYVPRGTGTSSGASFTSLDNAVLTGIGGTIVQIDAALIALFNNFRISPTRMLMNAQQHLDASNKMVATGAYNTFLQGVDLENRQVMAGGIFMTKYINKAANGMPIIMETQPNLPPGTIILITEVLPYPNNEVNSVFEVETQMEYTQIEYAMSRTTGNLGGPRYDLEVRAIEVFKNYFPAGCAAISNIAAG